MNEADKYLDRLLNKQTDAAQDEQMSHQQNAFWKDVPPSPQYVYGQTSSRPRMISFGQAVKNFFSKGISGRATRAEYWYIVLFNFILSFAIGVFVILMCIALGEAGGVVAIVFGIFGFYIGIKSICLGVRRLHDINASGWWALGLFVIAFVLEVVSVVSIGTVTGLGNSLVGLIWLIIALIPSTPGTNNYGPPEEY